MIETYHVDFDGHRVAYRVAGAGPALVVLHLYRRREDVIQLRLLSHRWRVLEIAPLGYGRSDCVPGYAGEALPVKHFDWSEELMAMTCPRLLYWGSEDRRQANGLRRGRDELFARGTDFVEFPGLGHEVGGNEELLRDVVIPTVVSWADQRLEPTW